MAITYGENKAHLKSLVPKRLEDLLPEGKGQLEDYLDHHMLSYVVACIEDGSADIERVKVPESPTRFSLSEWVNLNL